MTPVRASSGDGADGQRDGPALLTSDDGREKDREDETGMLNVAPCPLVLTAHSPRQKKIPACVVNIPYEVTGEIRNPQEDWRIRFSAVNQDALE